MQTHNFMCAEFENKFISFCNNCANTQIEMNFPLKGLVDLKLSCVPMMALYRTAIFEPMGNYMRQFLVMIPLAPFTNMV